MFNLRLWIKEKYHSSMAVRVAARIERLFLRGGFNESIKTYLLDNGITIDELLSGISDDSTRNDIKVRYIAELKNLIRYEMSRKKASKKIKVVSVTQQQDMHQAGHNVVTYIMLGGKLADIIAPLFTMEQLCDIATRDVTRRFIIPQLMKEKINVVRKSNSRNGARRKEDNVG